jgi:flagellar hook assembly protein FlgD
LYLADTLGLSRGIGGQLLTAIDNENHSQPPSEFVMLQNYPNPFNSTTLIKFSIPTDKSNYPVELTIYDIQGKIVKKLINEKLQSGNYVTRWEGINDNNTKVTSGVYFCRGRIGEKMVTMKMLLLK